MEVIARRLRSGIGLAWTRYEGPTWLVAATVYGGWFALVWFHAHLPWWLIVPLGAIVIAWHNSLQHETIHALVHVPRRVRFALGFAPLGVLVPYPIYARNHRKHHRDAQLTHPTHDPESYYHHADDWRRYTPLIRSIFLFNQTLLGRLTIGPLLDSAGFVMREARRLAGRDGSNLRAWGWHAAAVTLILVWVADVAGMPVWQYLCFIVYPGLALGMLRSFAEHRYAVRPQHRTAIVESGFPFNVLFLNNNLHLIHHRSPALPWYRIPAVWRASRAVLLEEGGGFYFEGYAQVAARHAFEAVFVPVHPSVPVQPTDAGTPPERIDFWPQRAR